MFPTSCYGSGQSAAVRLVLRRRQGGIPLLVSTKGDVENYPATSYGNCHIMLYTDHPRLAKWNKRSKVTGGRLCCIAQGSRRYLK